MSGRHSQRRKTTRRGRVTVALLGLSLALGHASPRDAFAGNLDTFMLGNDAPLMGGAVTATAKGSTAIWYNPAGLVGEKFQTVDVSFNAYVLRFGGSPDLTVDESKGGSRQKLTNLDISPVPTALAYTRRIGGFKLGAGLFVPNRGISIPRTLVRVGDGNQVTSLARDGSDRTTEYYAGLSLGRALTPRFRIGAAVFGYYSSQVASETLYAGATSSSVDAFAFSHTTTDQTRLGYQAVWGMQWSPNDDWQLGATFRSPVFEVYQLNQTVEITGDAASNAGNASSATVFNENTGANSSVIRPMRVHVGGAWKHDHWQIGLDGSVQAPFHAGEIGDATRAVWNVRVGVQNKVGEKLLIGGGLFTDLSPYDAATSLSQRSIDYYGVTVALRLGELLTVRSESDPNERPMFFGSTFAFSYALGTGTIANQELATAPGGARARERFDSITAHEFVFHVGSSLSR